MLHSFTTRVSCALVLFALLGVGPAVAQEEEATDTEGEEMTEEPEWEYGTTASLNGSQAAFSNWEEGAGTNSLAFTAALATEAKRRGDRWIQEYALDLGFGLINQENQEVRKAEDEIAFNTSLRYQGEGFFQIFNPTIAGTFRSQFANGFDYDNNPFEGEVEAPDERLTRTPPVQSSEFLAPAFITESIGLTYEPFRNVTIRFGAASKQTVVRDEDFRVLYGVSADKLARVEGGAELAASLDRNLTENIRYQSQLNTFYAVNQTENPPDARWQNTLSLKVNDWLSTNLQLVTLFDDDISSQIQLKETLSVGVSFTLI